MKITGQIEMMMTELTRSGVMPRYILIGKSQYKRWVEEYDEGAIEALVDKNQKYMNCEIIICNSDLIEVVAEAKVQLKI